MSRKKFCLDRSRGFVSRDPAHFPSASASLQRFCLLILISFSAYWWHCHRVEPVVVECVNHGSIRGSWPMAISGYSRGHNVEWVTRCLCTQGQISLTDTSLETSIATN